MRNSGSRICTCIQINKFIEIHLYNPFLQMLKQTDAMAIYIGIYMHILSVWELTVTSQHA